MPSMSLRSESTKCDVPSWLAIAVFSIVCAESETRAARSVSSEMNADIASVLACTERACRSAVALSERKTSSELPSALSVVLIVTADAALSDASVRTLSAITAKPRPSVELLEASMLAFSARMWVCVAMRPNRDAASPTSRS